MLTIHHLGVSQSDRIVWLMEELGLPYELKWYDRGPDGLLPPEYLALHPAATAPVIADGERVLAESAAIVEYISHRYGGGRLSVAPDRPNYPDYLYWMHFNNNVQGLFFAKLAAGAQSGASAEPGARIHPAARGRLLPVSGAAARRVRLPGRSGVHVRRHHGDVQPDVAVALRRPHDRRPAERAGVRRAHHEAAGVREGDGDRGAGGEAAGHVGLGPISEIARAGEVAWRDPARAGGG